MNLINPKSVTMKLPTSTTLEMVREFVPRRVLSYLLLSVISQSQYQYVESDVVDCDIPLLMPRSSMKRVNIHLNFENDTANAFNQDINLIVTKSGHYVILLTVPRQLIHGFDRNGSVNITLSAEHFMSKAAVANKLHCQFAHPPPVKLLHLLSSARNLWSEDKELKNEIKLISKNCSTCKLYIQTNCRFTKCLKVS